MTDYVVNLVIIGKETASQAAGRAEKSLKSLGSAAQLFTAEKLLSLGKQALTASTQIVQMGAQSIAARDRLIAFAGGSANADAALANLRSSADYTIDRFTATAQAARLMQMGVVESAGELSIVGSIVNKLGDQTLDLESRMQIFTMMMANQSKLRLDTFGLSVERVTEREKALKDAGYSAQDAFKTAVYEEAERALGQLGDTSDSAATKIGQISAALETAKTRAAELVTEVSLRTFAEDTDTLAASLEQIPDKLYKTVFQLSMLAGGLMNITSIVETGKSPLEAFEDGVRKLYVTSDEFLKTLPQGEGYLDSWQRAVSNAGDAAETAAAQVELLTVAQAKQALDTRATFRRRQDELADFARRAEELEQAHQDRIAQIIASGQQSAAEIARAGYQARLDALNAAMQAELAALTAVQEQRRHQEQLESLARQHEDNLARIYASARESETQAENRRFQEVMDNLNAEQQARLQALRAKYGKEEDSTSKKERLEEEHRRRMMGLYTDSARAQEQKRYEEALKELDYQEEEAGLLEQFQEEKAAAEEAHQNELESIRQRAIERQIEEENRRYNDAVAALENRRAQQQADAAAREEIETRYEAQRLAMEAELNAQLATIQAAEIARRIAEENAAYASQQDELQRSVDRAELTWKDTLERRRLDYIEHLLEIESITQAEAHRLLNMLLYPDWYAGPGNQGQPWEYQHGTNWHPGGMALVGERGPELLELPSGSRVTPMSKLGAAGEIIIYMTNNFGAGAVRSDRDIYDIAENIERSLQLRGVRTF